MELFEGLNNLRRSWPVNALESVASFGARSVIKNIFGEPLNEDGLWKRQVQQPLEDARQGIAAVEQAARTRDTRLEKIGKAGLANAVIAADEVADDTPLQAAVAEEVKAIAKELPLDPQTDLADNPLVPGTVVDRVAQILGEPNGKP